MSSPPESPEGTQSHFVGVGARIVAEGREPRGTIGAIVGSIESDRLLAVTTAQVVGPEAGCRVHEIKTGGLVGFTHVISPNEVQPIGQALELLGLITLNCVVDELPEARVPPTSQFVSDPIELVGRRVWTADIQSRRDGAAVTADTSAHFRTPNMDLRVFAGLLEIMGDSPPFADETHGGAPVLDEEGRLIGLIVGGTPERTFVAPIADMLRCNDLVLADSLMIRRHNRFVTQEGFPTTHPASIEQAALPRPALKQLNDFALKISHVPLFYLPTRSGI